MGGSCTTEGDENGEDKVWVGERRESFSVSIFMFVSSFSSSERNSSLPSNGVLSFRSTDIYTAHM